MADSSEIVQLVLEELKKNSTDIGGAKVAEDVSKLNYVLGIAPDGTLQKAPSTFESNAELLKRIQGTSEDSTSNKDPFKFFGKFDNVTDGSFWAALEGMHSNANGVYDGYWRALIGSSPVEVYNFAIHYASDKWIQVLKSPYRWNGENFNITEDTRYRTIYRIHNKTENSGWGDWRDTEAELEDAISKLREDVDILSEGVDPEKLDSLKDLIAWVEEHGGGVDGIKADIEETKKTAESGIAPNSIKFVASTTGDSLLMRGMTFDNNVVSTPVPLATGTTAGAMSADDKKKTDTGFVGVTQSNESIAINSYTLEGVYNFSNVTFDGGSPILNNGVVSGRLTVLATGDSDNKVITQVLNLNNNQGGEGNVYIRSWQNGVWKPWGKLQTNIEAWQVNTLDNLTDNGIYSGVLTDGTPTSYGSFYDTFVLIVINNYSVAGGTGTPHCISQLKYSLKLGGEIVIQKRTSVSGVWGEWSSIGGSIDSIPTAEEVENIDEHLAVDALRKTPQTLTESEKEIARGNIDAVGFSDLNNAISNAITNALNTEV